MSSEIRRKSFSEKNLSHLPLDNICETIDKNVKEIRTLIAVSPTSFGEHSEESQPKPSLG
jgi:predicted membrane chloride channel (bestrophin family)